MYPLLRPILFKLPTECAHHVTLSTLQLLDKCKLLKQKHYHLPKTVMRLSFPNPLGLAAGCDKNADYFNALGKLGFGFIEVGTVTPKPQIGNLKPRLFRLPKDKALINRLGFNNKGVDYLVEQVKQRQYQGVLGINIGKNFDMPNDKAHQDYCIGIEKVYQYADYITINISSPSTKNIRDLQEEEALKTLFDAIKQTHHMQKQLHNKHVPLVLKIAPDVEEDQIKTIANTLLEYEIDGVIATNTLMDKPLLKEKALQDQHGGLSGAPIFTRATHVVTELRKHLNNQIPIIGLGGIMHGKDAKEKLSAGADLIQIYTGLVYRGPQLIKEIINETL